MLKTVTDGKVSEQIEEFKYFGCNLSCVKLIMYVISYSGFGICVYVE